MRKTTIRLTEEDDRRIREIRAENGFDEDILAIRFALRHCPRVKAAKKK